MQRGAAAAQATCARMMAGGDLTASIEIQRDDEVGQLLAALRQTNINLHSIIGDVRANFDEISVATDEIADGNMDLSGRTESQASSLQQTASSMEQLTATVQQSAPTWPAPTSWPSARAKWRRRAAPSCRRWWHHGRHQRLVQQDPRHHRADRRHRLPDQYPGAECGGGGGARRRAGTRLCGGGQRGARLAQRSATAAKEIKELIDTSIQKVQAGTTLTNNAGQTMNEVIESVAA
jgi:aerotaxis receptor